MEDAWKVLSFSELFCSENLGQTNENFVASRECCLSKVFGPFFFLSAVACFRMCKL